MRNWPLTICATSGKGGVGKTNLTVNLSYVLANSGKKILIVDGDLGLANVDVLLGIPVDRTIRDVLLNDQDPKRALVEITPYMSLLPASSGVSNMVTLTPDEQDRLGEILRKLMSGFDYVLVDTAAGIGPSVLWFNNFADYILIVTAPDPSSLTDAYALIKVLHREFGRELFHVVVNFASSEREARQVFETLAGVTQRFLNICPRYVGAIPRDNVVVRASRAQLPFVQKFPLEKASRAIFHIANRILKWGDSP